MNRLFFFSLLALAACKDDAPADDSTPEESVPPDDSAAQDADGDGSPSDEDCDDNNAAVYPGADEVCDDLDNDCDAQTDEDAIDAQTYYSDNDRDGFGQGEGSLSCLQPPDTSGQGGDCDDANPEIYPDAAERCDGLDNDCDDAIDEDVQSTWFADNDGDGHGDPSRPLDDCDPPEGYAAAGDDCDDNAVAVYPGAPELCNNLDDDCDTSVDEEATDAPTWYQDTDSDGYGDDDFAVSACEQPNGYAGSGGDCDDATATTHPDAPEQCNGVDDDCDTVVDDGASDAATWYADSDQDGYGDPGAATTACSAPSGTVADGTDCDDSDTAVHPGASELCNGADDDCDSAVDEDAVDAATWYTDGDQDGYGDPGTATLSCAAGSGEVGNGDDCDDTDGAIHPAATEVCDNADNDCDQLTDDDDPGLDASSGTVFYQDSDGDTYGDPLVSLMACDRPSGYRQRSNDCDDTDSAVNPGASEACNGVDDDCDTVVDDGVLGTGSACPAGDCLEILGDNPSSSDGLYWIDLGGSPTELECDMTTDGGGWTLVFSDDFESTPDGGWSLQTTTSCGSFSTILGGYGVIAGGSISNTISTLGLTHSEAMVNLQYVKLDSWDGETAYVSVDGTTVWSDSLYYYEGAEVCGWNRGWNGSYDNEESVSAITAHSAASLLLLAYSGLNQDAYDESFGLDDVEVWVR